MFCSVFVEDKNLDSNVDVWWLKEDQGPFIFYEVEGAGGIWEWVTEKNGLKGEGASKKNKGKGGVT